MKKNSKIRDAVIFLLILSVLLLLSSYCVKPKGYDTYDLSVVRLKTAAIKKEPQNSIDVVFAGNSASCYTFSPLQLWRENNITSYDLGTGAQRLCDTYAILYENFKLQKPKVVVLETDSLFDPYPGIYEDDNKFNNKMEKLFPILHYHAAYNQIQLPKLLLQFTENRKNEMLYKGFQLRETTEESSNEAYLSKLAEENDTDEMAPIAEDGIKYLSKIKDLCQENGSELILMSVPNAIKWSYSRHNAVAKWAQDNDILYVDLNIKYSEVDIDWTTDTYDGGEHVNIHGSKKVTAYVGKLLKDQKNFEKKPDNVISKWDKDYQDSKYSVKE